MPALRAMRRTEGRKMATTPVELMTVPIAVTAAIKRTMSRASSLPARRTRRSPTFWATPVRTRPSPSTNRAPIRTTLGSLKPERASAGLITPVRGSSVIMISATASIRGRLSANITVVAARRMRTTAKSVFIAARLALEAFGHPQHAVERRLRLEAAVEKPGRVGVVGIEEIVVHQPEHRDAGDVGGAAAVRVHLRQGEENLRVPLRLPLERDGAGVGRADGELRDVDLKAQLRKAGQRRPQVVPSLPDAGILKVHVALHADAVDEAPLHEMRRQPVDGLGLGRLEGVVVVVEQLHPGSGILAGVLKRFLDVVDAHHPVPQVVPGA